MKYICAEWDAYMEAYRLYFLDRPQQTVAYVDDLEEAKSRGYDVIVR